MKKTLKQTLVEIKMIYGAARITVLRWESPVELKNAKLSWDVQHVSRDYECEDLHLVIHC